MSVNDLTTYEAGILQARAYRKLRSFMAGQLESHGLTMMQWALLGTIAGNGKKGIAINELAEVLDVEGSLVTNMVNTAVKAKSVVKHQDPRDKRSRIIVATPATRKMVNDLEKQLRGALAVWLAPIPRPQLEAYMESLRQLTKLP